MKTHFELVGEFHTVFDYPVRTDEYLNVFKENPKLLQSRLAFIREERDEFVDSLEKSDMVEMADALCDLIYFAHGSGQCLGIVVDDELKTAGHESIATTSCDTEVDVEILKDREAINSRLNTINSHIDCFATAINEECFEDITDSLTLIIIATYQLGYYLHFDMDQMFREVHRSNMTKVCHSMQDAEESLKGYLEEGRYAKPVIRVKEPYFLIYDEDLNKILKSLKWEYPNLRQFMGKNFK